MSADRSLTARDVAAILGVSRSQAYDFMRAMEHERFGPRCIRVKESVFNAWRVSRSVPACDSTNAGKYGGFVGLKTDARSESLPAARTRKQPTSRSAAGSESALIRITQPRIRRPSVPPRLDS